MTANELKNLETALLSVFSDQDARSMARLLQNIRPDDTAYYENLDLPAEVKDDCLLMAFEERLLIPQCSLPGGAWQDCMLKLEPGVLFIMPRVIKEMVELAAGSGAFDPSAAVRRVLAEQDEALSARLLEFFNTVKLHAVGYKVEAGLMNLINQKSGDPLDLHETLDLFVLMGMMSPCIRGPMSRGLLWYEINPGLYWGNADF